MSIVIWEEKCSDQIKRLFNRIIPDAYALDLYY